MSYLSVIIWRPVPPIVPRRQRCFCWVAGVAGFALIRLVGVEGQGQSALWGYERQGHWTIGGAQCRKITWGRYLHETSAPRQSQRWCVARSVWARGFEFSFCQRLPPLVRPLWGSLRHPAKFRLSISLGVALWWPSAYTTQWSLVAWFSLRDRALGLLPIIVDDNGLTVVNYNMLHPLKLGKCLLFSIKMSRCL